MTGAEQEYDHYDDPNNGDMQIIVPNKLLLFKVAYDWTGKFAADVKRRGLWTTCLKEVCGLTTTTSEW